MRVGLIAIAAALMLPGGAQAAPQLDPLGSFSYPVGLAAPPRDGSRLFVLERAGGIRITEPRRVGAGADGALDPAALRPTRAGRRKIRRALARDRRVRLTIRVRAVDAAGNVRLKRARSNVRPPD